MTSEPTGTAELAGTAGSAGIAGEDEIAGSAGIAGLAEIAEVATVRAHDLTACVAGTEIRADSLRALRERLADHLYRTLHQGAAETTPHPRDLSDPAFVADLKAAVPHTVCRVPARSAPGADQAGGDETTVVLQGVRVTVPRALVRTGPGAEAADGGAVTRAADGDAVTVELPPCRPALSPGFLAVLGTRQPSGHASPVLRVYLHIARPQAASAVWGTALRRLEDLGVPYQAKVLAHPDRYPRKDAMVVYLGGRTETALRALADTAAGPAGDGIAPSVSPFARRIGPGVAIAWEPHPDAGAVRRLSFGQHRARAYADGLIEHSLDGTPLARSVARALRAAGADPEQPYRNSDSPPVAP
ncbi:T3SS effector HopA1 family protein [Streptomyces luteocolor]|uniref:T3SS effector HopA1 family protein n=1 Tax=Streptomyces luteocolor TaxID=285500 RepID=UPI0008537F05|nr:T3SS effector HopA1 family protein [Streptomyces luteocolor]